MNWTFVRGQKNGEAGLTEIEFFFDFASPNVYLASRVLPSIANAASAKIVVRPALLGGIFKATGNQSPMQAFAGVKGKLAYEMLEMRRFVERHGLSGFSMNPYFPINTLPLMRGLIAARRLGVEDSYTKAISAGMWEEGLNMGEPAVVASRIASDGVDSDAVFRMSGDDDVKRELIHATEAAVSRGVFGLPTFFVGGEMYFGKDRLDQVREAALASRV
ncbi:MAG: 2-hydroxychromene-2-carboxylate isomerase [Alphaproteobacteria bacterium]|nr:2-hydroxychromene-2-carboxylate isomerase [Alphaproteobacteria bacterium]